MVYLEGVKGFMEYEMISEKELDRLLKKEQGFADRSSLTVGICSLSHSGAVNIPYERLEKGLGTAKECSTDFYCERGSVSMVAAKGDGKKRIPGKESDWRHPFLAQKAWIEAKKIDREKQQDYS